jgi:sortase A
MREQVDAAGGRAQVDVADLLGAFHISHPGDHTDANVRRWLRSVGLEMAPSLRDANGGPITLYVPPPPSANGGGRWLPERPPPPLPPEPEREPAPEAEHPLEPGPEPTGGGWVRRISITMLVVGFLMVLEAGVTILWKEPFSAYLNARSQDKLEDELAAHTLPPLSGSERAAVRLIEDEPGRAARRMAIYARRMNTDVGRGDALGQIKVDELDVDLVFVQGTDDASLRKAPGHYGETVLPGQPGTVGIAGHRTTYGAPFRNIDDLDAGDKIVLTMPYGRFTYRVQGHEIVPEGKSRAFRQVSYQRVVLSACHPLQSSSERILVYGRLIEREPLNEAARDDDAPPPEPTSEELARRRQAIRLRKLGKRDLVPGMRGKRVRYLQWLLGLPRTGHYGPQTEAAVREFQRTHDLPQVGRVGPKTRKELSKRPRPPTRPPTPPDVAPAPPRNPRDGRQPGQPPTPGQQPGQ